ncbi:MAG: hypothetical protein KDK40_03195 [Chlamydiia bacterium]|nr:hypothetical protein [Chlamydiia bacterium]
MQDNTGNNVVRFLNITRKKDGIFANFKVKVSNRGVNFTASIAVALDVADVDTTDPLEKIIEKCADRAVEAVRRAEYSFEGFSRL